MGLVEVEEAIQRRKQELEMYEARLKEWGRREGVCVCVCVYVRESRRVFVCMFVFVCVRARVCAFVGCSRGCGCGWVGGKGPNQPWMEGWVDVWVGGRLVAPTSGGVYMVEGWGRSRWVCLGYVRERERVRE
jgi:hypothetical protein